MKIALVAPLEEPVPPSKYGGTELVVANLANGLVRRGHTVYLLAAGDSRTEAQLIPILPKSIRKMYPPDEIDAWRDYWKYVGIAKALEALKTLDLDIVHNHYSWRVVMYSKLADKPIVSTLHGPLTSRNEATTYSAHAHEAYVSISNNQRSALPHLNWVATVYNGIEVERFKPSYKTTNDYFAFIGRTSPEKGLADIIQLVRTSQHQLKIAAKVDSVDQQYFDKKVKPYIDNKQIEFVGEVGHEGKNRLLKGAKALLSWLNWEEPFGLVVPEANACGTPVIVNRRGSMPELVENGVNGYLVDTKEEMLECMAKVDNLSRRACRKRVEEKYSVDAMVEGYERVYKKLLQDSKKKTL